MAGKGKILIIKLGALGDMVQAIPAFQAIRAHHPGASLTLMTIPSLVSFAKSLNIFDEIWQDPRPKLAQLTLFFQLARQFKKAAFTHVYDLQLVDRTALYFYLFGFGRKVIWVGAGLGGTHRLAGMDYHKIYSRDRYKKLLALAGIKDLPPLNLQPFAADVSHFSLKKPYALLIPGASNAQGGRKRWPVEGYAKVASFLKEKGVTPVVIGGAEETFDLIKATVPETVDLTGKTNINEVIGLAREALVAIGNDTGPLHVCGGAGVPLIGLYNGFHDPAVIGARSPLYRHLQCESLTALAPERVIESILSLGLI